MKSDKMSDLRKNIFRNQKITRRSEKVQFEWIWNEIKTCKLFKKRLCAKLKWNEILKWKEKKINKQILHCKFSIKKSQNLTCKIIMTADPDYETTFWHCGVLQQGTRKKN